MHGEGLAPWVGVEARKIGQLAMVGGSHSRLVLVVVGAVLDLRVVQVIEFVSVKLLRQAEGEVMAAVLERAPLGTELEALAVGIAQAAPWQIYLVELIKDL